jgi:5-methylthioadenosine/S-adenosylhomocysteine deaminase
MNRANLILSNATILTMDDECRILNDSGVAIAGDKILDVGSVAALARSNPDAESLDCDGKILIPGLINAHTHSPMTLLRGLADDRRLEVWLLGYMMPVEREFVSPEFCQLGARIACAEMIRSGVTCFADMYYFEDIVASAVAEAGMRAVCGQTVLKFPAPDAAAYEDSLSAAREFLLHWKDHPLITPSVAPHAAYTTTPEILRACTAMALDFDVPLQIHISETSGEVEQWRDEYDMPVVPWVKKQGILDAKVLAAHCVHIDEGEIHTLQHAGAGIAHNPTSNMKLASGFAPVIQMLEEGLAVGIGTDGPSSNNDLDMFEEMRLATFLAKGRSGDPTVLPARQVFAMATRMGAKALHLGDITGSIEPGKRADLVLLDLNTLHNSPHFSHEPDAIYARIVYAAKSTDVTDVMVNGRWLLRDRQLTTLDEERLLEAADEYARRIDHFIAEREESVLSKLVAIGGAQQQESYEVQIKLRVQDPSQVLSQLRGGGLEIIRRAHYLEYDTYFEFENPEDGRLRYREDEFVDDEGEVFNVRYRLTQTGPAAERTLPNSIVLSRSRFIAPARHSLRFYREYFDPVGEVEITKDRLRWLVRFEGLEFFVNLDQVLKPELKGYFLEIKSRTWSRRDAEHKAELISKLLQVLDIAPEEVVTKEYPELIKGV